MLAAYGLAGSGRRVLAERELLGRDHAVDLRRADHQDAGLGTLRPGGGQQLGRAEHVDPQDLARVLPALTDVRQRGQVIDGVGRDVRHHPAHGRAVGDVGLDVDDRDLVAAVLEVRGQPLAHEALAARDQRPHVAEPYCDAARATS